MAEWVLLSQVKNAFEYCSFCIHFCSWNRIWRNAWCG